MFPPRDILLLWDGEQILWSLSLDDPWRPLSGVNGGAIQYPQYADAFDSRVPAALRGYSPPFLAAMPELGGVQIWTGLVAKTRPGWSLSVRLPVNLPPTPGLSAWEGVVETDIWLGPLFANVRITKTDFPVCIRADTPFIQVQPIPQIAYREETLSSFSCVDPGSLTEKDWDQLGNVLLPSSDQEVRQGNYAVTVRRRRLCPVDPAQLAVPTHK